MWWIVVSRCRSWVAMMRTFPVCLPSGARYWTVLDDGLAVVSAPSPPSSHRHHVTCGQDLDLEVV
jgi:hypothetical protein